MERISGRDMVIAGSLAVALGLVAAGASVRLGSPASAPVGSTTTAAGEPVGSCRVTDGDTIRCGSERVRLLGIDAPELPGHCRPGRDCAPGDPYASTDALGTAMSAGPLTIRRVGTDRYGRTLALVVAGGRDLSCAQVTGGRAIYKPRWDDGGALGAICPAMR